MIFYDRGNLVLFSKFSVTQFQDYDVTTILFTVGLKLADDHFNNINFDYTLVMPFTFNENILHSHYVIFEAFEID